MISRSAGIQLEAVPYKSEPDAVVDLLSGRVQVFNASATTLLPHIRDGKLKALFTTLSQRSPLLPDVPSITEAGLPKLPIGPWGAVVGPPGLADDIVRRLNKAMVDVLARENIKGEMAKHGFVVKSSTPEELGQFIKDQLEVWKVALKEAGIEPQ
jgi:tripartite-type tricarboxylate transporter receptor subunit TctC